MLITTTVLSLLAGPAVAAPSCPPSVLLTAQDICYEAGGYDVSTNVVEETYTPGAPFDGTREVCVHLDLTAELEAGGYDRVYVRFDDGVGPAESQCVVGDTPGDCATLTGGGCATLPTSIWDIQDDYCYLPADGATAVDIAVYVQPYDLLYNCGDCPPGGSPGVSVHEVKVVGCTGAAADGCGDGAVDAAAGEQCDDGNAMVDDGCDFQCQREAGAVCTADGAACTGEDTCRALAPPLPVPWCYSTADDVASSPLSWSFALGTSPGPLLLHWDVEGTVELHTPQYDALMLSWSDDTGAGEDLVLNNGDELTGDAALADKYAWSAGSRAITPGAGATSLDVRVWVATDGATSCAEPKPDQSYEPLKVNGLSLTSCPVTAEIFDTQAAFFAAAGSCQIIHDFNAYSDGDTGPFTGDGFVLDSDSTEPSNPIKVSAPTHWYDKPWGSGFGYLGTQASGDGTNALEPQAPGDYVSNSRLSIEFTPHPARAVALNLIDAGDWGGVMAVEAWAGGELVYVNNDPGATGLVNNYIVWKGFVFSKPVDRVVFFMIDPSDHFAVDNVIVQPQEDSDGDAVPDQCDCAPNDEAVAGSFPEVCDDGVDNDCDGVTDGDDPDCGGGGTTACGDYAHVDFAADGAGWLTSGDQSWAWSAADAAWTAVGAANLDAVLESAPITIPGSACPGFVVTVELGGATQAPGDTLTVSYAVDGGAFAELDTLSGALSPQSYPIDAQPGQVVSFRFTLHTDGSGLAAADPEIAGLSLTSDSGDGDGDGVCDACDCAPESAAFGFDCDADGDGWCAVGTGALNADPAVAGCANDTGAGGTGEGTDCDDAAAAANPGNVSEATSQCSDGLDNDCDGLTDAEDTVDCPVDDCVDADGDGFGQGTTCAGADCDDTAAGCTTDCSDSDGDQVPDCKDPCLDADGDGYGVGDGCAGADCDDGEAQCTTDCTTDLDGNTVPDCQQDIVCADQDGDHFGVGPDCSGADCDDGNAACTTDCVTDVDQDGEPDCADACVDADGDGYGAGPACTGADCDDASAWCTSVCSDADGDGTADCLESCEDADGDGYGVGPGCAGADCDDTSALCTSLCTDANANGVSDCKEGCEDADGDGYGVGPDCTGADCDDASADCTTDCADGDGNGVADCAEQCEDHDGDGYGVGPGCAGADCDDAAATCTTDCTTDADKDATPDCADACVDADGDGYGVGPGCTGADCDDGEALCAEDCADADANGVADCAEPCEDADGDGYGEGPGCLGPDCNEGVASCNVDCETDDDGDGVPNCEDESGFTVPTPDVGAEEVAAQGGCQCRAGSGAPIPWEAAFVALFLLAFVRRRRVG